jgi:thiol:disulfide interchange protein DsbD
MKPIAALLLIAGLMLPGIGLAGDVSSLFGLDNKNTNQPVDPEKAFVLSLESLKPDIYRLRVNILDCCYLYREKTKIELVTEAGGVPGQARLNKFSLPPGKAKHDDILGDTEVYYAGADVIVPILNVTNGLALKVTYQGCSEKGVAICYAPMTKIFPLKKAKKV